MVRRRSARQITASRRNLVKARRKRNYRRAAVIGGTALAVGGAAYATHRGVKENGLKKKHGAGYIPRKAKYSHYTNNNAARRISKTRNFHSTGKNSAKRYHNDNAVWLTRHNKRGHYDGEVRDMLGKARVTVKLSRKEIIKHKKQVNGNGFTRKNTLHVQVAAKAVNGRRIKHNLPKTARGVRGRAAGLRRIGETEISRNMAVSPLRRRVKKRAKARRK